MFDSPTTTAELLEQLASVRGLCDRLDPVTIGLHEVADAFDALVATRKLLDGAVTRMTARYEQSGRWRDTGAKDAVADVARRTGTSSTVSRRQLDTSKKLDSLHKLDDALRRGEVSHEQAATIADGAVRPDSEDALLHAAKTASLSELRRAAAGEKAAADADAEARRERLHRNRSVRRWIDEDGAYNLHLRCTPEQGAELDARLKPVTDEVFAEARAQGRREPITAYAADALLRLVAGAGSPVAKRQAVRPDRKVIATIDAAALRRGRCESGESATIAGVGPVSVSAVRGLLGDAAAAVVIKDGVDILNVTHLGRQVTAHQRTALEARGYRCEVVGCGSTNHLEIDHVTGWQFTRTTCLDDLSWLCTAHHARKTREGLVLHGPPGRRTLVSPDAAAVQDELFATAR